MSKHVVIIGGGVAGLSAAVRLAATKGQFRVTLIEKNPRVGGKLNLWEVPHPARTGERSFRFDTGPSLLTMPFVFMDLFAAAGEDVRNHLKILPLDPIASFRWEDGTTLNLSASDQELRLQIARISPSDVHGWMHLLQKGRKIWQLSEEFLSTAPEQLTRQRDIRSLGMLALPFRIGMFSKFAKLIDRNIQHPKLRDVLYQYATYSGASPFRAPATFAVIPFVEHHFGAFHIEGGMYRLAETLERIARKLGVEIHTNCWAEQIEIEPVSARDGQSRPQVKRVSLMDGTSIQADVVIANSDVVYTYRTLIAPQFRPRYSDAKLNSLDPGGSGMILMLGVDGTYPQLAHHTKFMPRHYRTGDLDAMFESHTIPNDPCIYVCAPTRTDSSLAPEGCEALFILASAPAMHQSSIDWKKEAPTYRKRLIDTLESKWGLTDLSKRIVVEKMMTPPDLRNTYNANAGSIYGIASNDWRSAFFRPPNRDRDIRGLYFAGGATHPGGGLPLVALSGKVVSDLVKQDYA